MTTRLLVLLVLVTVCFPVTVSATSWAYSFVVWNGYEYIIEDEQEVMEVDEEIGEVTKYSDMEQHTGNFSNTYKEGTSYYSIAGVSTEEAIAVEKQNGIFIRAERGEEYTYGERDASLYFLFGFGTLVIAAAVFFYLKGCRKRWREIHKEEG
ncbi:hypothetical protein [Halobacillus sp. A5]|uniref:hypothetical protein n=1 Tax=Halobacillus sp. A5 TaxID=2880263 RepID=UPI0020A6B3A3|nr:hypothetical protein [Halobacillus sp. A5]MCP3028455.1 hypothetical protein [Halobacillus sp. A5]